MKNYRTVMLIIPACKMIHGRKIIEDIENQKFDSIDEIKKAVCLNEIDRMSVEDLAIIEMTDFVDLCNNTDDDTKEDEKVDISKVWIGYVQLNNSVFIE